MLIDGLADALHRVPLRCLPAGTSQISGIWRTLPAGSFSRRLLWGGHEGERDLGSENLRIATSNERGCLNPAHFTWSPNYRGGLEICLPLVKTWLSY